MYLVWVSVGSEWKYLYGGGVRQGSSLFHNTCMKKGCPIFSEWTSGTLLLVQWKSWFHISTILWCSFLHGVVAARWKRHLHLRSVVSTTPLPALCLLTTDRSKQVSDHHQSWPLDFPIHFFEIATVKSLMLVKETSQLSTMTNTFPCCLIFLLQLFGRVSPLVIVLPLTSINHQWTN